MIRSLALAAYVSSSNIDHARAIAARLRAGTVNLNYPAWDVHAPFGGYKQSGNGREYADFGIDDYLELKAVVGYAAVSAALFFLPAFAAGSERYGYGSIMFTLDELAETIAQRANASAINSYTGSLLEKGRRIAHASSPRRR